MLLPARFQVDDGDYGRLKEIAARSGRSWSATGRRAGSRPRWPASGPGVRRAAPLRRRRRRRASSCSPRRTSRQPDTRGSPRSWSGSCARPGSWKTERAVISTAPLRGVLPRRLRRLSGRAAPRPELLLLAAGHYFYASWDPRFLGLLIAVTLAATRAGPPRRTADRGRRKGLLAAGLAFNLTVLGFFIRRVLRREPVMPPRPGGLARRRVTLRVILPVGICSTRSWPWATHRRVPPASRAARNLRDFAVFIGFFPRSAGPIMRSSGLLRQIACPLAGAGAAAEGSG